ncbi:asparagine synthase [Aestuariibacter halophilus]|uniref:asparagine synthase (glutamine-hydrolyzing) n=1 Tax=Fluctibacter halophilus TaxID=226011 RepID=A0ABS8G441_9ALTE|nr:asparagine synthase-related protein [Aestuariibacter halophilus]MCC2614871.1 asparagine synthase [Aestuariibacter halophilus]
MEQQQTTSVTLAIEVGNRTCHITAGQHSEYAHNDRAHVVIKGHPKTQQGSPVDAEGLLLLWDQCGDPAALFAQLYGRYFITLVDTAKQQVVLFNDHMGMQPGFYAQQGDNLHIADNLGALRHQQGVAVTLNRQAIYNYFYSHCIPAPDTIYQQCFKLEPAKAVIFEGAQRRESLLYQPHFATQASDPQRLQKDCLSIIDEAVSHYITDDCGAFLSGGLDSSTVAGMLARHKQPAKTFSIGFHQPDYDETAYAQITARHFNTDHEVLYLEPEQAAEKFVEVAQYFDEPFGNSSAMAAYFCALFAKQHGVTHLLAGDGGDELFAGNERYVKQKKFEVFHGLPGAVQWLPRWMLTATPLKQLPGFKKVASYIRQADVPLPDRLETYNFIHQFGASEMFAADFLQQVDTEYPTKLKRARYQECSSEHSVDRMLYLDWKFTLADNDLVKVSKMCELAGVEVDYPLLDKALVDFSCTVPADVKLPGGQLRDFYKRSCKGFLADETLNKSKHGFGLPFGVWMKENQTLQALTHDCLSRFKQRGIVQPGLIDKALQAHQTVHAGYYGELIWIMVILELWLQKHGLDDA